MTMSDASAGPTSGVPTDGGPPDAPLPAARARAAVYPETGAGGFCAVDGTVSFYVRLQALLRPEDVVLDFGAGRGRAHHDDPVAWRRRLMDLRGCCAKVIGADIDPAVFFNPSLDEARLIASDGPDAFRWPLADGEASLILADHVLEHLHDPDAFAAEAGRVLRPGGWLCARTPNRWGPVALAARLIPEAAHGAVLARAQPHRRSLDVFPTFYRLNDRPALRAAFPPGRWSHHSHFWTAEPAYAGGSPTAWRLARAAASLLPGPMGQTLHVFLRKRG